MYCLILSNSLSHSLKGVSSRLAKCITASFFDPYDISQMVRVFCMVLVGRTWPFNKRFIRLLFPALVLLKLQIHYQSLCLVLINVVDIP